MPKNREPPNGNTGFAGKDKQNFYVISNVALQLIVGISIRLDELVGK